MNSFWMSHTAPHMLLLLDQNSHSTCTDCGDKFGPWTGPTITDTCLH